MFLRLFKHLLPTGRATRITTKKQLRDFIEALATVPEDAREYADGVLLDVFPQTTRELDAWELQFGLPDTGLTEQQRRDRLAAAWQAKGGQDPRYIQDTLQANGFEVYIHEWWVPGTEPAIGSAAAATARNPVTYLKDGAGAITYTVECGEPLAECGEVGAEAGETAGAVGYALVNTLSSEGTDPNIPVDPTTWPYFLYFGGETFPATADVPLARRDEFEALCLKISPTQHWLGMLISYT